VKGAGVCWQERPEDSGLASESQGIRQLSPLGLQEGAPGSASLQTAS